MDFKALNEYFTSEQIHSTNINAPASESKSSKNSTTRNSFNICFPSPQPGRILQLENVSYELFEEIAVEAVLPKEFGGKGIPCRVIDLEFRFSDKSVQERIRKQVVSGLEKRVANFDIINNPEHRKNAETILSDCYKRLKVRKVGNHTEFEEALKKIEELTVFNYKEHPEIILVPEIDAIASQLEIEHWAVLDRILKLFWSVLSSSTTRAAIVSIREGGFFDRQNEKAYWMKMKGEE